MICAEKEKIIATAASILNLLAINNCSQRDVQDIFGYVREILDKKICVPEMNYRSEIERCIAEEFGGEYACFIGNTDTFSGDRA